jgi:hypothetical protein
MSQIDDLEKINRLLERQAELRGENTERTATQTETSNSFFDIFSEGTAKTEEFSARQGDLAGQLDAVASSSDGAAGSQNVFQKALGFTQKAAASLQIALTGMWEFLQPIFNVVTLQPIYSWMYEQSSVMGAANTAAFEAAQALKSAIGALPKTMEKYSKFTDAASKSSSSFGRSLGSIFGGAIGDVMTGLAATMEELGVEFDLFMDNIQGAEGHFLAFNKGLGVSVESLSKIAYKFDDTKAAFADFATGLVGGSKELGLNIKSVGKNFDSALKNSTDFGYMTRKELTATTLYATRLGLEMDELSGMTKKFDTFEGAAESVGKLNTAFGIQLDTMDMVMETNPAKRLDMIRKALEGSGQSLDTIMGDPRKSKYLADNLEMSYDQIQKIASVKTDEFGFTEAIDAVAEGQEKMSEQDAMIEMVKQIKSLNAHMGGGTKTYKGFFSAFTKGFSEAIERTAAFQKMFGTMQSAFASFYTVGAKVARLVGNLFYNPGLEGTDGKGGVGDKTAEDAPLFKYFFKPFLDYFAAMKDAATLLTADGGPIDKVFDYVNQLLDPETYGKADKNFNIFEILFAPFKAKFIDPRNTGRTC